MHSPRSRPGQSMHGPRSRPGQSMHSPRSRPGQSMHSPRSRPGQSMHSPRSRPGQSMDSPRSLRCIRSELPYTLTVFLCNGLVSWLFGIGVVLHVSQAPQPGEGLRGPPQNPDTCRLRQPLCRPYADPMRRPSDSSPSLPSYPPLSPPSSSLSQF